MYIRISYIRIRSAHFITKMKQGGCHCRKSSFYDFTKLPPHLQSRQARQGRCQNSIKMKIFAFIVSPVAALLFKHPPSIWQSLIVIGTFTSPQFQSRAPGLSSDNVIFKKFQIQYSSNCSNTSFYLTESDSDREISTSPALTSSQKSPTIAKYSLVHCTVCRSFRPPLGIWISTDF